MAYQGLTPDLSTAMVLLTGASAPRNIAAKFSEAISVRDFGAVGDGVTDDSAAFIAARNAWKAAVRVNPAPNSDGNKVGTYRILIPPGSYLITQPQALLDSSYTVRTAGMSWEGTVGGGAVQIIYLPSTPGGLLYNNDAVLGLRFKNISFVANSSTADFMESFSAGGAQDYGFEGCSWSGTWGYGLNLTGSNNNSEFFFNNCGVYNNWTAFLNSQSSDQFLNYWFNECKVQNLTGTFLNMTKGGSIKIHGCDFSGYAPSSSGSVLFNLLGNAHAYGVTSFSCLDSRFEINSNNAKVMHSEWPGGSIKFDNCDFTSAGNQSWAATVITHEFVFGNVPGPAISFKSCGLIGQHSYAVSSNDYQTGKSVSYRDCDNVAFTDFYGMFAFSNTNGSNYGGWPAVHVKNCRGLQQQLSSYDAWAPSTAYSVGKTVYSDQWAYTCSVAGTSGTAQIYGAGTITDGGVTWVSQPIFNGSQYINDGQANLNVAIASAVRKKLALFRRYDGNLPSRYNSSTPGSARVVLPPNSIITRVFFYAPAGAYSQAAVGSFLIQTDQQSPTNFINYTSPGNLSAGFTAPEWNGYFSCGTSLQSRSIIFQAGANVSQGPSWPAVAGVEYICGE